MLKQKRAKFALSSIAYVASLAAQRGLPFLALPIVARATTQTEYGNATMAVTIGAVISVIMSLGINSVVPRAYHLVAGAKDIPQWPILLVVQLAFSGFIVLLGFAIYWLFHPLWGAVFATYFWPTLLLSFVQSLQLTFQGLSIARSAGGQLLMATTLQLGIGLMAAYPLASEHGGVGYIFVLVLASIGATLILAVMSYPRPSWDGPFIKGNLRLAFPFIGQGLSTWLVALFDRLAIGLFLGATFVGGYQVAYMAGAVLGMILEGIQASWVGKFYSSSLRDKDSHLRSLSGPSVNLAIAMICALMAVGPTLMPWIAPNYEIDYGVIALVALSAIPRATYFLAVPQLLEMGRSASIMTATLVSGIFTVVATCWLVPWLGVIGGGIVTLGAFIIQSLVVTRIAFGWRLKIMVLYTVYPLLGTGALVSLISLVASAHSGFAIVITGMTIVLAAVFARRMLTQLAYSVSAWTGPRKPPISVDRLEGA